MLKNVYSFVVNFYGTNTYLYKDPQSNDFLLIDPGGEIEEICNVIKKNNFSVCKILITHSHFDHIMSLEKICDIYPVPVVVHKDEIDSVVDNSKNLSSLFGECAIKNKNKIKWCLVSDGEKLFCGNQEIEIIHTPGHTKGGICVFVSQKDDRKILFSGDTLFCGSIGRTDLPGGNYNVLLNSLKKIISIPMETLIFPGHGNSCVLRDEVIHNEYLKQVKSE